MTFPGAYPLHPGSPNAPTHGVKTLIVLMPIIGEVKKARALATQPRLAVMKAALALTVSMTWRAMFGNG